MTWTKFTDMHSGGSQKLEYAVIYIQAQESEAVAEFSRRFNRDPENITCFCCGEDFYVDELDDNEEPSEMESVIFGLPKQETLRITSAEISNDEVAP